MIELQQLIFDVMKADSELLNLLGLTNPAVEADISKRLMPTPPTRLIEDVLIHYWFPVTYLSSRNSMWENRHIQFRIYAKDLSLITQQKISRRIQQLFCDRELFIPNLAGYSKFFYVGEGQIPGRIDEWYGWFAELRIQTQVRYFSEGG